MERPPMPLEAPPVTPTEVPNPLDSPEPAAPDAPQFDDSI
jgi:hypothetical protein